MTVTGKFSFIIGCLLYVFGSCKRHSKPKKEMYIPLRLCKRHSKPTKEMYIALRLCKRHSKPTTEMYIPLRPTPEGDTL